jgi:peptidoglycan hydrolase-like protein with peptidoglycan-binding domain
MLVFGPDVVADMVDRVNTIVSMDLPEEVTPNKALITQRVQQELQRVGYSELIADGIYGNGTREAVLDFQRRTFTEEEMESSIIPGTVDRRTWDALLPDFKDYNKMTLWRGQVQQ